MRGPIDYIIVGFEGNKFDGSILEALIDALDMGIIKLVALSVITKDKKGTVLKADITEVGKEYELELEEYLPEGPSPIDKDDVEEVGDLLENNTAAGLLVVEQLWAKPLKKALLKANGVLIADGRIHPEAAAMYR
jgi:hypothetical protein